MLEEPTTNIKSLYKMQDTLHDLFKKHNTDKGSYHSYDLFYDKLFESYRDLDIQFCEIGVLEGGSLRAWKDYFSSAEIVGFDLFKFPEVPGVKVHKMNQEDKSQMYDLVDSLNLNPTIVIDDGGHEPEHHQKTLAVFFKKLKPGGIYIIEDLQVCHGEENPRWSVTKENNTLTYLKQLLSETKITSQYMTEEEERYLIEHIRDISFEMEDKLAVITKK